MTKINTERSTSEPGATAHAEGRLAFEMLIVELSSRFINRRPDEVDAEIKDALRQVCELLDIDLAVIWQWSLTAPDVVMPTHVYAVNGGQRPSEPMRQEDYPWSCQQMLSGCTIAFSSVASLPPQAAVDAQSCRHFGIRSALCLPISTGDQAAVGALAFNALQAERDWPEAVIRQLQLIAQIFAHVLARRRDEKVRQDSEKRLTAGSKLAGLAFYEVDYQQGTVYADERFRELCGVPAERVKGLGMIEFWQERLHPDDRERVLGIRPKLHDGTAEQLSIEYRFLHPTLGERWIEHDACVTRRDAGGRTLRAYGAMRDVTERKRIEHEMRDLSRRLIRAHEDERAKLARELHDDVTQRLALLAIEAGLAAEGEAPAQAMQNVRDGLKSLSKDVHSLAYQLHPSILRELGLVEALQAECERRARPGQFEISMDLDPLHPVIGVDAEICLFRVAQEALNNVSRHARARAASVTLKPVDGGLMLTVHDDGVGFNRTKAAERGHLGLASMRERIQLVSGALDIESAPGQGTAISAWVPPQGVVQ